MSSNVAVTVEGQAVVTNLAVSAKKAQVSVEFLANDTMRLCLNDIMRNTPPPTLSAGRNAVAGDIQRIFEPVEDEAALAAWRGRVAVEHDEIVTYTKRGRARINAKQLKATGMADMRVLHERNRNRQGRIHRNVRRRRTDIWGGQYLVPERLLRQYIRARQSEVGTLMSHWAGPLGYYAAKTRGKAYLPQFATRHGRNGRHSGRITFGSGAIVSTNDLPYASRHSVSKGWWHQMLAARQRGMTLGGQKRMDDIARRFNAGGR